MPRKWKTAAAPRIPSAILHNSGLRGNPVNERCTCIVLGGSKTRGADAKLKAETRCLLQLM